MSTKKKFNLASLRKAMQNACETNDVDYYRQFFHGPTNEQLDAEHEEEFRLYMEEVDMTKRLSLLEFLDEVANHDFQGDLNDVVACYAYDLYRLYLEWCKLADKPNLNEAYFLHGLYLFGFVSENVHCGIEKVIGIGIVETDSEVRLNLQPNIHAELN